MYQTQQVKNKRLISLDLFRGLTVAAMILVNTPGDEENTYAPLKHSVWHGCTPTDLVFPSFLFMVGVSIVYALETKKQDLAAHGKVITGALKRMLTLIALGLSIFLFYRFDLAHLRFPGVLQRIGVVYFIATVIYLKTSPRTCIWLFGIILLSYYLIMAFIPVPDGHPANLSPEFNLAAWVDRAVFTTNHMYRYTKLWDPVGVLSTWPAIATALLGIRVGEILKQKDAAANTICRKLIIIGICSTLSGLAANYIFPINKQLWTSSYVLYAGGLCTLGLTAAYWLVDVKGHAKYAWVMTVFGTNAISAYMLSEIMPGLINFVTLPYQGTLLRGMGFIYQSAFVPFFSPQNASLLFACAFTSFIWLIMLVLYKRKIVIKV